jgi:pre-mRNA-processing factor SLU7
MSDRKKSRELAEARQSGAVAPAVDVKTGHMINPHNPDFITKRPWYLGGANGGGGGGDGDYGNNDGPSLDHQADPTSGELLLSMQSADLLVKAQRKVLQEQRSKQQFQVGMWVEAFKNNKAPYRICQLIKIAKKGTQFDLQFEDGTVERNVKFKPSSTKKKSGLFKNKNKQQESQQQQPRIRMTKTGARTYQIDQTKHGKETYDSKRDKYHGYEPETHTQRVEQIFTEREEIRKQNRQKEKEETKEDTTTTATTTTAKDENNSDSDSDNDDSDSDAEGDNDDSDDDFVQRDANDKIITTRLARQGGVGGAQMKVTARNLRIREDTAKYLRNLDPSSAYYDPKSRSMRDNPNPEIPKEESLFVGDNFARISGDAVELAETHMFAWDAADKAGAASMHPQANPSQVELLKKKFQSKSAQLQLQKKQKVLDKYGGSEYLDGSGGLANAVVADKQKDATTAAKERKIRFGVSTVAEEFSRDGRLLKGSAGSTKQNKYVAQKSKYEEDVYINGHTSTWGSYFQIGAFSWGYADDHSLIRNSYGTGDNGRKANDEANEMRFGTGVSGSAALAQARGMLKALPSNSAKGGGTLNEPPSKRSRLYGEADQNVTVNTEKVKEVLKKMDQQDPKDDRKRKYNSLNTSSELDVTEEEMEAYRLRKERGADPMAKLNSEELLDYK